MKYEWRKKDKSLYLPKPVPTLIEIPNMNYLTLKGTGNPNNEQFTVDVEALYALSYGIRMLPKSGITPDGYFEYTVFPLEGHWGYTDEGIMLSKSGQISVDLKDYFKYTIMIRQPDFVTPKLVEEVRQKVMLKKKNPQLSHVNFETIAEGLSLQMMHLGSYDNEPESFKLMEDYCNHNNLERLYKSHKEIYLTDPKKVIPEKLKTTIRFQVKKL